MSLPVLVRNDSGRSAPKLANDPDRIDDRVVEGVELFSRDPQLLVMTGADDLWLVGCKEVGSMERCCPATRNNRVFGGVQTCVEVCDEGLRDDWHAR